MAYTTIQDPEKYFQVVLYTGNGSNRDITLPGDTDLQPNLVWIKQRGGSGTSHTLFDSVRGVQEAIFSNGTNAETTRTDAVSAFNSDGFSVGSNGDLNANTETYVAWNWKEDSTAGFDIVTFTGNQTARTISHSLGVKPQWMWIKNREKVESWHSYHTTQGATKSAETNGTGAYSSSATIWNNTEPTSSVFTVGNNGNINETNSGIVVYLWSGIKGFSKFGKYEGNNNADGPYVFTGFRPAWVMIKRAGGANGWFLSDTKRVGFNGVATNSAAVGNPELSPNLDRTEAEGNTNWVDIYSNGFKPRITGNDTNGASETYVYMAFAYQPMVNSDGIHSNAR